MIKGSQGCKEGSIYDKAVNKIILAASRSENRWALSILYKLLVLDSVKNCWLVHIASSFGTDLKYF